MIMRWNLQFLSSSCWLICTLMNELYLFNEKIFSHDNWKLKWVKWGHVTFPSFVVNAKNCCGKRWSIWVVWNSRIISIPFILSKNHLFICYWNHWLKHLKFIRIKWLRLQMKMQVGSTKMFKTILIRRIEAKKAH